METHFVRRRVTDKLDKSARASDEPELMIDKLADYFGVDRYTASELVVRAFPMTGYDQESDDVGECDFCDATYLTYDREDHCAACGNCHDHCIEDENCTAEADELQSFARGDFGS